MQPVEVHKGRTEIIPVSLGFNVSGDTITSQIRTEPSVESTLIATWDVSFKTDGTDGELILTLDDEITSEIAESTGYMDLKRVSGGEPLAVISEPLLVVFINSVTE